MCGASSGAPVTDAAMRPRALSGPAQRGRSSSRSSSTCWPFAQWHCALVRSMLWPPRIMLVAALSNVVRAVQGVVR